MESYIRRALEYLTKEYKNFVIYPYGKYGRLVKQILNEDFGIQENYVVDNALACSQNREDNDIRDIGYMKEDYEKRDFQILLAVDPAGWNTSLSVHREVDFADITRISDILSRSTYFCPWNHFDEIRTSNWPKISLIECVSRGIYRNKVNGAVVEAGVYRGQTARFINCFFPDRKLYLFDTFEGFDEKDQKMDDDRNLYNMKLDYTGTSVEYVMSQMHHPKNVVIKKGWFPETAKDVDEQFAFVRLDMDLYDPIYSGLDFFYPKMTPGGYIIVHDCRSKNFDGARAALIDFCKKYNLGYMCAADNLGSAVICVGM